MVQAPSFLAQLVRSALGGDADDRGPRDPAADPPDAIAVDAAPGAVAPPAGVEEARGEEGTPEFDEPTVQVLAQKVLEAWLRNRYQLLFPFALDLKQLDRRQAELLVYAMIAAAQADGTLEGRERARIAGALDIVNPHGDEAAFLEGALSEPKPLNAILADVRDVQTAALVYAASLMAVDQRNPVNRHYLRYLAARLQLAEDLVGSLEQRFRS